MSRKRTKQHMPGSVEAERALLGAILINESAYSATEQIATQDAREVFTVESHAALYNAFKRLVQTGATIDPVTVLAALAESGDSETVTPMLIAELSGCVPTSTHAQEYAGIVMDAYTRRKLIELARRIDGLGMGAADENDSILSTQELLRHAQWRLESLCQISQQSQGTCLEAPRLADLGIMDVERIAELNGAPTGIPTGLTVLDGYIHGWDLGDYIILGARPGTGKSAFAINAMLAAAQNGVPSLMFSCEMTQERIAHRAFGILAGMHSHRLRLGFNVKQEVEAARRAAAEMRTFHGMRIDPVMQLSVPRCRQKIKEQVEKFGTSLIIIDYIGRVKLGRRTESRRHEVEAISGEFQGMAKEFNTPLLVLSQLNNEAEFKESGAINENADISMKFENLDDKQIKAAAEKFNITNSWVLERLIGMRLTKNRNGPVGNKYIIFDKDTQKFYPVAVEKPESVEIQAPAAEPEPVQQNLEDYDGEKEEWPY